MTFKAKCSTTELPRQLSSNHPHKIQDKASQPDIQVNTKLSMCVHVWYDMKCKYEVLQTYLVHVHTG